MSNLLKRGSTISREERVIDYNELIKQKLQTIMDESKNEPDEDGFVHGLTADVVEQLVADDADPENYTPADAAGGLKNAEEMLANANAQAQEIIDNANEEAARIIAEANEQAEQVLNEAQSNGYNEGMKNADEQVQSKMNQLAAEYADKHQALDDEYTQKLNSVEPQLVDVITDVFQAVVATEAAANKDILMHLINSALNGADRNAEYTIKVSSADYGYVSSNQGKISCGVNKELDIEVLEDVTLQENQCIIETDGAVFDCSLDVELDNLIKKIRMLSCMN